jgi:GntR family transcriptional regulator / MocR family aminotransferase
VKNGTGARFRCRYTSIPVKQAGGYTLAALTLDCALPVSLHRQLYDRVRKAILKRQLRGGTRLPSTRILARELGVSRNTVITAFEQLMAEGYLEGKVGSGTYVARTIPDEVLSLRDRAPANPVASHPPRVARRAESLSKLAITSLPRRAFEPRVPAVDLFPTKVWGRLVAKEWSRIAAGALEPLTFGEPAGLMRLRQAVADYVGAARGVTCEASQVIITNGLHHGVEIASRVLLDPGDYVWLEDPAYPSTRAALQDAGARVVHVPVIRDGVDIERYSSEYPWPRLIYVTPSHQFPLGVTMSVATRLQVLQIASRADAWILEDDYDSEYRHAAGPIPSIQGLDMKERVIYIGTFSKVLFPALRLGYLIVPRALIDTFTRARMLAGRTSAMIDQAVVADFIDDGHFDRHIRRMRSAYRERHDALMDAGQKYLTGLVTMQSSHAGMHVVGWLEGIDDESASRAAAKHNIEATPLSYYCAEVKLDDALVLGYGAVTPHQIRAGAETLARALSPLRRN